MNINQIKQRIKQLIEDGYFDESQTLIDRYKNNIGNDDEILSMESIINIYKGDYDKALTCIREGLLINNCNADLYFTMGNIYEYTKKYDNAYLCYEKALSFSSENSEVIAEQMNYLVNNYRVQVKNYSIIILTHNKLEYTKLCIDSIRKYNGKDGCEIIVVDNNSTDGTVEYLKEQDDIKYILNKENKGFPAGCNQGIEYADKENDIFLLNNDTVIMENSIFNLRMGLYSSNNIGAAGPVSNNVSNYQKISDVFNNSDECCEFARKNNITNMKRYEDRNKLVGFAMFIKRTVLDRVGMLDERFTPGNYEDDDLSVRIIESGNRLLLCRDSYIHHFGSVSFRQDIEEYNNLLMTNSKKFSDKWGFKNLDVCFIRYDYLSEMQQKISSTLQKINILDIGCGFGGTGMLIKNVYPNASVYGLEENDKIINIAKNVPLFDGVEQIKSGAYRNIKFDFVMVSKSDMNKYSDEINQYINYNTVVFGFDGLKNQENINFTGERLVINNFVRENYNNVMQEHLERYKLASKFVKDKIVVDAACGTGYGSVLLADKGAKSVTGIDISEEAIVSAKVNYSKHKNVDFIVGDVTNLDIPDSSVDVFVSFETIEHISKGCDLIREANRVLKNDGIFIVSTPNRNVTNPGSIIQEHPANKYHCYEYAPLEFIGDLLTDFTVLDLYGQTVEENIETFKTNVLRKLTGQKQINFSEINKIYDHKCRHISEFTNLEPMYIVSVCKKKNKSDEGEYKEPKADEAGVKFYSIGNNSYIGEKYLINNPNVISIGDNVIIKDGCWLNDCQPKANNNDLKIIINDRCEIGSRFSISVANKCVVEKNVLIGPNVYIADCEHNYKNISIPIKNQGITSTTNQVVIGEGSWIGINAVIIGNVKIGKGCVIAANSYVTQDVPDYSVVAGCPAKIKKMYDVEVQDWVKIKKEEDIETILTNRIKYPIKK